MELDKPGAEASASDKEIFGLLGEKLTHSFSPQIHKSFGIDNYELIEIPLSDLEKTLKNTAYKGFNVTIPYKRAVMELCDEISGEARAIGSVNTIVRQANGKLLAYNTDIDGFMYCARLAGIDFSKKKVLIFGSGATSLTAQYAAINNGAAKVAVVSRHGEVNYSKLGDYSDADIIINATPVGMYPNNLGVVTKLELFPNCSGVIDVVYNPRRTALIMDAQRRGIACVDGLPMLVYQAKRAQELFLSMTIPDEDAMRVISELRIKTGNIILIGMPGSGKSTVAKQIAEKNGLRFVNIDTEIMNSAGKSIPDIFEKDGEPAFRAIEHEETKKAGMLTGAVIATGGGVVKDINNYAPLHQNGRIYHLYRRLEALDMEGRPLSPDFEALAQMQIVREPMYRFFADAEIQNNLTHREAADRIWEDYCKNNGCALP